MGIQDVEILLFRKNEKGNIYVLVSNSYKDSRTGQTGLLFMSDEGYGTNNLDERVRLLERKLADLDALIKGLTDEMLDMKAVVMKLKKEQRPPPVIQAVAPPISRGKVEREITEIKSDPEKVQPHPVKGKVTLKMQPDGTLLPEKDMGDDIIVASARTARMKAKDNQGRPGQNDLIIAEDKDPAEGS